MGGLLTQTRGVETRGGDMRMKLVGEADKAGTEADEASGLWGGGRERKQGWNVECGGGERGQRRNRK